jgi:hypothetical protein
MVSQSWTTRILGSKFKNLYWELLYFVFCVGQRLYGGQFPYTNIVKECTLKACYTINL